METGSYTAKEGSNEARKQEGADSDPSPVQVALTAIWSFGVLIVFGIVIYKMYFSKGKSYSSMEESMMENESIIGGRNAYYLARAEQPQYFYEELVGRFKLGNKGIAELDADGKDPDMPAITSLKDKCMVTTLGDGSCGYYAYFIGLYQYLRDPEHEVCKRFFDYGNNLYENLWVEIYKMKDKMDIEGSMPLGKMKKLQAELVANGHLPVEEFMRSRWPLVHRAMRYFVAARVLADPLSNDNALAYAAIFSNINIPISPPSGIYEARTGDAILNILFYTGCVDSWQLSTDAMVLFSFELGIIVHTVLDRISHNDCEAYAVIIHSYPNYRCGPISRSIIAPYRTYEDYLSSIENHAQYWRYRPQEEDSTGESIDSANTPHIYICHKHAHFMAFV